MATRAHSTRAPLLPAPGVAPPLLPQGLGRQPGPVTIAIAAMRAVDPEAAIEAIREGLDSYFVEVDRQRVRNLRRAISIRIAADIALLDALGGDPDIESAGDDEPSLSSIDATSPCNFLDQTEWSIGGCQDRETGEDNSIVSDAAEQGHRSYGGCA